MSTNRIKHFLPETVSTILKSASVPTDIESQFAGQLSYREVLDQEIEKARDLGYRMGYEDAITELHKFVEDKVQKYIGEIFKIGFAVFSIAKTDIPNLKITHYLAKFSFETETVSVFFGIDSSTEDEISFSNLLNKVEQMILKEDKYISETHFANKKNSDLDFSTLKAEYPYQFNSALFEK